jgi:hypothetical protein
MDFFSGDVEPEDFSSSQAFIDQDEDPDKASENLFFRSESGSPGPQKRLEDVCGIRKIV